MVSSVIKSISEDVDGIAALLMVDEDPRGANPPVSGSDLAAGGSLRGGGRQGTRRGSHVQRCDTHVPMDAEGFKSLMVLYVT